MAESVTGKKYRYRVKAVCTAYVGEEWIVTSDHPLTDEEAEEAILDDCQDGVEISCVDQDVSDEHDRSVNDVETIEEEA